MSNVKEIKEIGIVHLLDLEDGLLRLLMQFEVSKYRAVSIISKMFTSFLFSRCDTTRINKGDTSRKTHLSLRTNIIIETFQVRRESKLPS